MLVVGLETDMENIKELRLKKGLSQVAVAKACGVSLCGYLLWERGVGKPTAENLAKLKAALGVKADK
jgi:transcriptional regulator with XRE-family HTH domain